MVKIDFIGVGAPKAGTTWISHVLSGHPDICFSIMKETSFYCEPHQFINNSLFHYNGENSASYSKFYRHCLKDSIKGEFSVHYLSDSKAYKDIYKNHPDVKILIVLRDPIQRFISDYNYRKFQRKEISGPVANQINSSSPLFKFGLYAKDVKKYISLFGKENVHVVLYDDIKKNPHKVIENICKFLTIDCEKIDKQEITKKINETAKIRSRFVMKFLHNIRTLMIRMGMARTLQLLGPTESTIFALNTTPYSKVKLSKSENKKLRELYMKDILELEKVLGRKLNSWKE